MSNYNTSFIPQLREYVEKLSTTLKDEGKEAVLNQQKAQANAYAKLVCDAIKGGNTKLDFQLGLPYKNVERMLKFVQNKVFETFAKANSLKVVMVDDATVLQYIIEYYELDDKEAFEKELEDEKKRQIEAEEMKKKAEEKAKKKAEAEAKKKERLEKDLHKAKVLIEKMFVFSYTLKDKELAFMEKMVKTGVLVKHEDMTYSVNEAALATDYNEEEVQEAEDDEFDDSDLDFDE